MSEINDFRFSVVSFQQVKSILPQEGDKPRSLGVETTVTLMAETVPSKAGGNVELKFYGEHDLTFQVGDQYNLSLVPVE